MAKRRKIALIYNYNENWIGGSYYIENLVKSLNFIERSLLPEIWIIARNKRVFFEFKKNTRYPFLHFLKPERNIIFFRILRKIGLLMIKKPLVSRFRSSALKKIEMLYPAMQSDDDWPVKNKVYWIPDFQEHFFPQYFSNKEVIDRKSAQRNIAYSFSNLVLSSNASFADFSSIYKDYTAKVFTLPFAVNNDFQAVVKTNTSLYKLPVKYFLCSNQFWKHKNHEVVLRAIHILKRKLINCYVVFTGKETDYRNPGYFQSILDLVKKLDIEDNVFVLGFIPRYHQLKLMHDSIGLIQPSLFEGWSTAVEDAKSLNSFVLASNLNIHEEQLLSYPNKILFDAKDPDSLADVMNELCNGYEKLSYDYNDNIKQFASKFINLISNVCN